MLGQLRMYVQRQMARAMNLTQVLSFVQELAFSTSAASFWV